MIAQRKATKRRHLPTRVTVRFVPLDRATEFHQKRIADAAAFFYALGAKKETVNAVR